MSQLSHTPAHRHPTVARPATGRETGRPSGRLGWAAPALAGSLLAALALTGCGPTAGSAPAAGSSTAAAAATADVAPIPATSSTAATSGPMLPSTATTQPTSTSAPAASPKSSPPSAAPAAVLAPGATGDRVRELQARLAQLAWWQGKTTGTYDEATAAAVRGFQDKRNLPDTGTLDATTWTTLTAMTRQPTTEELTNQLVPGPALLASGATGAKVRDLQARLKQLGWFAGNVTDLYGPDTVSGVKGFQDKRGFPVTGAVDQRTLDKLTSMTRPPTADELTNTPTAPVPTPAASALDPRCLVAGRIVCISKTTSTLVYVVDGRPQLTLDVRFGSENNPTREGVFPVYRKNAEWTSTIYGSSMPYSMFFSGGEAIHYSSDFAARGYAGHSHGCVNVRDLKSLAWLFGQVQLGDQVIVYR